MIGREWIESGADLYLSRISAPTAVVAADNVLKPRPQHPNSKDKDKDKNKNKSSKTHEAKKNSLPVPPNQQSNPSAAARQPYRLPPKPKGQRSKRSKPLPPTPTAPAAIIPTRSESDAQRETIDRRRAVLRALEVIASSSKVFEPTPGPAAAARKGRGVQMI
jgi:hypothetical protein